MRKAPVPPGCLVGSRFLAGRIPDPHGKGARAVRFISQLRHTEGSAAGKPFLLHLWQDRIVRRVFGDTDASGTRRVRTVFLLLPRGNGKTTLVSALGLLCLLGPERDAAGQVICAAGDREQASIAFNSAVRMVRADFTLARITRVVDSRRTLFHEKSGSRYQAISHEAYSKFGMNISTLLADELHAWPSRELWEALTTSMGKREAPLIFAVTTAGVGTKGIAHELYEYALKVESGEVVDPSFLPVLYQAPADCDWQDEAIWRAVNPALGHFRSLEEMRITARRAAQSPVELEAFRRFYLNIWSDAAEAPWLDMNIYDKSAGAPITIADFEGRPCFLGIDMSSSRDLSAVAVVARDDADGWIVWCRQYCPADQVRKRTVAGFPYASWAQAGELIVTEGNVIDQDRIYTDVVELCGEVDVRKIGCDRWDATAFMTRLMERGLPVEKFGQGFSSMSAPAKEIERAILAGKFRHGGNLLLRWNFANVRPDTDPAGNIKFNKSKDQELKIDGTVSCAMAVGVALAEPIEQEPYYEKHGLLILGAP